MKRNNSEGSHGSVGSLDSQRSGDSDFDEDAEKASPFTWIGRRVNALVRTYRDVDEDDDVELDTGDESTEATGHNPTRVGSHDVRIGSATSYWSFPVTALSQGQIPRISSGYAVVQPKGTRRRIKFRRKFIMSLTWALLSLNLLLVGFMTGIFLMVKHQLPFTFGLRLILRTLQMKLDYDLGGSCGDSSFIQKQLKATDGCSLKFYRETYCRIKIGISLLHLFFSIPSFALYAVVAVIFLLRKKSRDYLKTLISALSSTIVYVCIFYLFFSVIMYIKARSRLSQIMYDEIEAGGNGYRLTQWWDTTQRNGKCCGVKGPHDWLGKLIQPGTNNPNTDRYPLSCCDPTKSKCTELPLLTQVYTSGCWEGEVGVINLYTTLTILILILGAVTSPSMKFLFYFIGRISKHYIGRKSVNLRTKFARCEAYGELELVAFKLSPKSSELVFYGRELLKGDILKGRVNRKRIFKLVIQRKRKRLARIMIRSVVAADDAPQVKKTQVVYHVAANTDLGIVAIIF